MAAWYRAGTIAVTNGSTTATGTGTAFNSNVNINDAFWGPDGKPYEIAAIVSDTVLTLATAYLGSTASGQTYQIQPTRGVTVSQRNAVQALIEDYEDVVTGAGAGVFPVGTAGAPSLRATTDTNTGVNFLAGDVISLVAGGTERGKVTTTGLNGMAIGATTPSTGAFTNITTTGAVTSGTFLQASGATPYLSVLDTGGATDEKTWVLTGSNGPLDIQARTEAGAAGGGFLRLTRSTNNVQTLEGYRSGALRYELSNWDTHLLFSNNDGTIGTATAHDLVVDTNSTERLRITSAGSVGIGTSSPTRALEVQSGAASVSITSTTTDANAEVLITPDGGGDAVIRMGDSGSVSDGMIYYENNANFMAFRTLGADRLRITSTGSVGIGTSSPTNLLDVSADSIRVRTAQTPASAGASGNQGEIAWDANYIYVCTATNTWKRAALATW